MASYPGWYISSPSAIVHLPVIEAHEMDGGTEQSNIEFETDGLKHYAYEQADRDILKLTFRVNSAAHLQAFRDWHDAVHGAVLPFYYVTSDGVTLYVKKRQAGFIFRRQRGVNRYEIPVELRVEPTDAELLE